VADVIERRRTERDDLLALARTYAERLSARLSLEAAVVAGSVARRDFNVWSDVDVVVIVDSLPEHPLDRATLLLEDAPPRVQPIGFTPAEFEREVARGNRLALEAVDTGVTVAGQLPSPGTEGSRT
jgi:predicted nucleotidyltransferase